MDDLRCIGCGAAIQSEDQNLAGFVPAKVLENNNEEAVVCRRCFRIKHYNELNDVELNDDDFLRLLHGIGDHEALVVMLVDIFDFNGSWINGINRFVNGNPVLLVGNKADILPHSAKQSKLKHWMTKEARSMGLVPIDVALMSAGKGNGLDEVTELIHKYREGRDVYVIGCTNVGKSTFINALLKRFANETKDIITVSNYPGTTLDVIAIPFDETSSIIDTPGIINRDQMAHHVDRDALMLISPKKEIKAKTYQLQQQQTLFFGGLARFDYITGSKNNFTTYIANDVNIHRTKLERADELFADHAGELLQPIAHSRLVRHEFNLRANEKVDLVISGLGWITAWPNEKITVALHAPVGVAVFVREALI
ncbi:MAG: ribosome biogenesis GTPase YqeH [Culicoidibacterales bacterium]